MYSNWMECGVSTKQAVKAFQEASKAFSRAIEYTEVLYADDEVAEVVEIGSPVERPCIAKRSNCANCGAPLRADGRCGYCGTVYR